jgi:hypothetical protein
MAHPLRLQPAVRHRMMAAFFYFSDFLRAGLGRGVTRRPPPGLALAALGLAGLLHDTCPRGAGRQRAVRFIPADSASGSSISESPARVPPGSARMLPKHIRGKPSDPVWLSAECRMHRQPSATLGRAAARPRWQQRHRPRPSNLKREVRMRCCVLQGRSGTWRVKMGQAQRAAASARPPERPFSPILVPALRERALNSVVWQRPRETFALVVLNGVIGCTYSV